MPKPTIVIGIGQAGCRMLKSVHKLVHEEGQQDSFQFFSIDTERGDLEDETPNIGENVIRIHLEKPNEKFFKDEHRHAYHYLGDQFTLKTEEGTGRTRPISRYHIEWSQNHDKVKTQLRNGIDSFVEETTLSGTTDSSYYNIWILNSLGGGTGSGAFPIISALVQRITEQMTNQDFLLNGIGSLPRLVGLQENQYSPYGRKILYANAYAALAELRELVNGDDNPNWSSPLIDVQTDVLNPGEEGLKIEGELFDKYWLIGFEEEDSEELAYRRRMNRIAANGIYYLANKDQPEDFPYHNNYDQETLAAITSAELRFPTEEAREFDEYRRRIEEVDAEKEALQTEISHHEQTVDYLTEIRRVDLDPSEGIPERVNYLDQELLRGCIGAPSDFDIPQTLDNEVTIVGSEVDINRVEEVVEELLNDAQDRFRKHARSPKHGESFDSDTIVDKFYCGALNRHLKRRIQNHEFKQLIDEVWNHDKWQGKIESRFPKDFRSLDPQPVDAKWERAVEEFISEYGKELEEERDRTLINPIKRYKLTQEIEELGEYYDVLPKKYEQYKKLTVLQDIVSSRFQGANESIAKAKNHHLEDSQEGLIPRKKSKKENKKDELETLKSEYEGIRDSLRTGARTHGYFKPALQNVDRLREADLYRIVDIDQLVDKEFLTDEAVEEAGFESEANINALQRAGLLSDEEIAEITEEMVVEWPSIASMVRKDLLDADEVAKKLSELLNSPSLSSDPVQDENYVEAYPDLIAGSMMSRANEEEFPKVNDIMKLKIEGQNDVEQVLIEQFDYFIGERVPISDGLSVRFVTWVMPVTLENTSEFGTLNRVFTDATENVEQELGEGYTDELIANSVAYPEVITDDQIADRLEQLGRK